jgi:hypothetical protein
MNAIVRKLEIYNLIGIGDINIIEMNSWLSNIFSKLKYVDIGFTSYEYDSETTIIEYSNLKEIYIHDEIWNKIKTDYSSSYQDIRSIIAYYFYKYKKNNIDDYNISVFT